jgi:ABC-type phosphate transport system substrate-binding protein
VRGTALGGHFRLGRALALIVGFGVIAATLVSSVGANAPTLGANCQTDGKISGRGATFAGKAQTAFINGFHDDVCGKVTTGDATGDNMVMYNYDATTGSGAGQNGQLCRHDAYGGSDIPYDEATLALLDGPLPTVATCTGFAFASDPPFGPGPGPFPSGTDQQSNIINFPIAGSAVAIGVNLQTTDCTGGPRPTALQFTSAMVSELFSGDIKNWNDPQLRAGGVNANLANCNKAITRVVRLDKSGTTQIFKNYLKRADGTRHLNDAPCTDTAGLGDVTWTEFAADANNRAWPDDGGVNCSTLARGAANGNAEVVKRCNSNAGGVGTGTGGEVCYADLSDIAPLRTAALPIIIATIRNSTDTAFVTPISSNAANCNFGGLPLPGTSASDRMGQNPTENYGFDNDAVNGTGNHSDLTFDVAGAGYPICGVTFALLYPGTGLGGQPIGEGDLNADQRRTLYSYELYILSSAGQSQLGSIFYAGLPSGVLTPLRASFKAVY